MVGICQLSQPTLPVRLFVHLGKFLTGKKPVGFQWKRCQHPTRFFVKIVVLSKYPF
jgi:hypothetical protein